MTSIEYLGNVHKIMGGDYHRIVKVATCLRELNFFPTKKGTSKEAHVTCQQAAHFVMAIALNANPYNREDFDKTINEYKSMKSPEGSLFIKDFATLLSDSGINLVKQIDGDHNDALMESVHRISFSLDRPFATIVTRPHIEGYNDEGEHYKRQAYKESETAYGADLRVLPFERFAILKKKTILKLAEALVFVGSVYDPTEEQLEDYDEKKKYINTIK